MHIGIDNEIARSFATIREMIADRGTCTTTAAASSSGSIDDSITVESVIELARGNRVFRVDVPGCSMVIVYDLNPKFKVSDVKRLLEDIAADPRFKQILLVVREPPAQIKGLEEVSRLTTVSIEMFLISELQFNVSKHTRVPKHIPIRDPAEIEAVLKRYRAKSKREMPSIQSTDAMARYFALKPGQLVRIVRFSPSAGTHIMYRCCVKN
jgi:DNA-directed RNA polymerase I, II, and III subunit RPABC1